MPLEHNPLEPLGRRAAEAAGALARSSTAERNRALLAIAAVLRSGVQTILEANAADIAAARQNGVSEAMIDRLTLTAERVEGIAASVEQVAGLTDPIGRIDGGHRFPNGIRMEKRRVPLGVVGMIYEARPNVTVDAAVLCLKTANACILRGGKEAFCSNRALAGLMQQAVGSAGLPANSILLVEDTSRDSATWMMQLKGYLDVLIPRGGAGLIRAVVEHATVPVIETGVGNCHAYVDAAADLAMALEIVDNGKTSRPSVCNALETLLVHRSVAPAFLPLLKQRLDRHHVQLRGCPETSAILGDCVIPATEADYETEFVDYILAIKVVGSLDEAIDHIARYSSHHSEVIITNDLAAAQAFTDRVDSAAVYVNASTRFTDGGEFGLGAEIGISTQKLHARGPMGLDELTTVKYVLFGSGQIR